MDMPLYDPRVSDRPLSSVSTALPVYMPGTKLKEPSTEPLNDPLQEGREHMVPTAPYEYTPHDQHPIEYGHPSAFIPHDIEVPPRSPPIDKSLVQRRMPHEMPD